MNTCQLFQPFSTPSSLPTCHSTSIPTCHSSLLTCHSSLPTCHSTSLPTCRSTSLPTCHSTSLQEVRYRASGRPSRFTWSVWLWRSLQEWSYRWSGTTSVCPLEGHTRHTRCQSSLGQVGGAKAHRRTDMSECDASPTGVPAPVVYRPPLHTTPLHAGG